MQMRKSLENRVDLEGVGLHGGQPVKMTLAPAPTGAGIRFIRIDVPLEHQTIFARYDLVSDTRLCTRLTNEHGVSVGTVEHVMAALAGCGITDALVVLDGPEVPIMDGSSAPFVDAILEAGIRSSETVCEAIRILEPVRVEEDGKVAELLPADMFGMEFDIAFADTAIGEQRHEMTIANGSFVHELSDCRTFGHLREVEQLRAMGLARGGSLQNAIVVDSGRVLNPEGLRRPDEFVRHKMLDAIGDLALAGYPIIGHYRGVKAGHEMTNRLLRKLFETPEAWTFDTLDPADAMSTTLEAAQHSTRPSAIAV